MRPIVSAARCTISCRIFGVVLALRWSFIPARKSGTAPGSVGDVADVRPAKEGAVLPIAVAASGRRVLAAGCLCAMTATAAPAQQPITLPPALRATLDPARGSTQRIQITEADGREITADAQPRVRNGTVLLAAARTRPFIVRLDQVERMPMPADRERVALPGGLVMPGDGASPPAWFQVTVAASPSPAVWDQARNRYVTRVWFGLRASDHAPPDLVPPQPVSVRVGFAGLNAEAVEPIELARPGLEHERAVDLHFLPTTAAPTLQVRSNLTRVDFELEAPGRLVLRPTNTEMPAFGLGTVGIVAAYLAPHGDAAPASRDLSVLLTVEGRATPDPRDVVIREGESEVRFSLRSAGSGPVAVRATAGALTATTTVEQTLPVGPWLAGLIGGALGGFLRSFVPKARRRTRARRVLEGLLVALVAYVAAVLGVAFLGLPAAVAATEAGAFLTGAIAGFAGVAVMETLTQPKAATAPR